MIALRDSALLMAAVLVVFGAGLAAPFHFDDYALISDPAVTSSSGWWQVWLPLETRPLTYFTFWLNYRLGGRDPAGYHAVNLALHLAAVLLLCNVLSRLIPREAAFLAALLFALHPIQSEAVHYIFARGTLLMTVFCLLALRSWAQGRHGIAVAWFAAALLAKEECVAFPALLLLLYLSISRNPAELRPIAAMFGLSLLAGLRVMIATSVKPGSGAGFQAGVSPLEYLSSQGLVILRYFRLFIVPLGFTVDPDIDVPPAWLAWACWLVILALAAVATRRFSRAREGFWFLAGLALLLPSSSIFPAQDLAADRRMYLPMCAFAAAVGLPLRSLKVRHVVVIVLAVLSFGRTQVWRSEQALWEEAVRLAPDKARPKVQLARLVEAEPAVRLLEEAKRLAPEDPRVASHLGRRYMTLGKWDLALQEFGRALALAPGDAQALNNRGVALMGLDQMEAARQDFQRALETNPCLFDARFNLLRLGGTPPAAPGCRFSDEQRRLLEGQ